MRTDSVNVSNDALIQVRELIPERFGSNYLPEKPITTNQRKMRRKLTKRCGLRTPCAPGRRTQYLDEDSSSSTN